MKRWLELEVSDDLRRVLESAQEDARPAAIARLERRLAIGGLGANAASGAGLRAHTAGAHSVPPAASSSSLAGTALGAKVVIALAAAGMIGALALRSGPSSNATPPHAAPVAVAPVVVPAQPVAPAANRPAAPIAAPVAAPAQPQLAEAAPTAVEREPSRAARSRPRASLGGTAPALRGGAALGGTAPALRGGAASSQLSDEVRQLDVIRRYLRVDVLRALAAADAHERRFPNAALGEERELLRIEALFRLGREREALARADTLVASPAGKAYRRQVQRLIARFAHAPDG